MKEQPDNNNDQECEKFDTGEQDKSIDELFWRYMTGLEERPGKEKIQKRKKEQQKGEGREIICGKRVGEFEDDTCNSIEQCENR